MARISKEQREIIRQDIIETSRQLFIEEGYSQTSTKKIAKKVGVAEGTIFNYFQTKSDILLEVITGEMDPKLYGTPEVDNQTDLIEIYLDYYKKVMNPIINMPKKIMMDIFLALFKVSKTAPTIMQQFAAVDFRFIDVLEEMTEKLQSKHLLKQCDKRLLAESLYSDIMYSYMIYLYDKNMSQIECYKLIDNKLRFTLTPFIQKEV
ncbi:MAG: TetR/AcrR family transcriptional regulator [Clostridiales bacterium]|nr:TetR/AcrR family transcriptional regulator [Clostridiales bacterium]